MLLASFFKRAISHLNQLTRLQLEFIYRLTMRSPAMIAAASCLLLLLSSIIIAKTSFEADIFRLFPRKLPALQLLLESLEWTGGAKEAYFLLEGDRELLPVEAGKLVNRLQQMQLDGKPAFSRITWRVYDESEGELFTDCIAFAASNPQLFISTADIPKLSEKLSKSSIKASVERLKSDISGQFGGFSSALATADPLFFRDLILPRLKAASQSMKLDSTSPYLMSKDGHVMIVVAEPARAVQDIEFARRLVSGINDARRGLKVSVSCAGAHMSAVLDEAEMKTNILSCILSSLVVVLLIFYAVYRRLLPTLLLPLIIAVGVTLALATASLLLPSIHIISFAFMALIIGLGTDYSVHLYDRYHSERAAGKNIDNALRLAIVDTGHGLFTAAATTAFPFFALMVSDVRALYELGLLVGLGVIFSLYATLFFLPPLLVFMERRFPSPFRPIPSVGMRSIWRLISKAPGRFAIVSVILAAAGSVAMFGITFDGELKNLQPRKSEAFMAQEKISRHLSIAPRQMLIAVDGNELKTVMNRMTLVASLVERYQREGHINGWSSLEQVINTSDERQRFVKLLNQNINASQSATALHKELEKAGFETAPFQPYLDAMRHFNSIGSTTEATAVQKLADSPLRGVVSRHLIKDNNGFHALLYLYYHDDKLDTSAFLTDLTSTVPEARATGVELVSKQLADSVVESFIWSSLLGCIIVLLLILSHFKSKDGIFHTFYPVFAGASLMLGTMAVIGMGINFMNAMVLVTIVGMGSDYGLHVAHRISSGNIYSQEANFVQSGRAVLISALTTIAGFGSLAFADYPALSSIGWATNLGVFFTALFALFAVPAFVLLGNKSNS